MFGSCKTCAGAKGTEIWRRNSSTMSSQLISVLKKFDRMDDFRNLPKTEKLERAQELTDSTMLWRLYFSGLVLDPARDHVEAGLDTGFHPREVCSGASFRIKVLMKPIVGSGQYGLQGQVTSRLLRNYGCLHASMQVGNAIVLEWDTSSLIIPTWKPISSTNTTQSKSNARSGANGVQCASLSPNDVIEHEFEAAIAKKAQVDKIISVVIKYNKFIFFDPINRNCQKFVADVLKELDYPLHPKLVGNLVPYYDELKRCQNQRKPKTFETHAKLNDYVRDCLGHDMSTMTMEYLLVLFFMFHMTSLTECEQPERWSCQHQDCLMPRLEQRIDPKDTLAYRLLQ